MALYRRILFYKQGSLTDFRSCFWTLSSFLNLESEGLYEPKTASRASVDLYESSASYSTGPCIRERHTPFTLPQVRFGVYQWILQGLNFRFYQYSSWRQFVNGHQRRKMIQSFTCVPPWWYKEQRHHNYNKPFFILMQRKNFFINPPRKKRESCERLERKPSWQGCQAKNNNLEVEFVHRLFPKG